MDQFAARVVLASSVGDWDVLHARVMSEPLADWESAGLKAITATATDLPRVCRSLVETACETLWPSPHSALSELHSNKPVVYLGLKSQNGCRVALKQGALTEISGETGVGKTQFCMTLATRALKDDSTLKVLWFESEGKLSAGRFREIALGRGLPSEALHRVHIIPLKGADELLQWAKKLLGPGHLVIVDSITLVLRQSSIPNVAWRVSSALKKVAAENFVCVTNQVAGDWNTGLLHPALGHEWSYGVSCRWVLCRTGEERELQVVKSGEHGEVQVPFKITRSGVEVVTRSV